MPAEREREHQQQEPRIQLDHPRCPFCHGFVRPDETKVACDSCMSWHHRDCWVDHGACASCQGAVTVVGLEGVSRPARPKTAGAPPRVQARRRTFDGAREGDERTCQACRETFEVTAEGINNPRCLPCHKKANLGFLIPVLAVGALFYLAYFAAIILG